jgi:hypothetical protein
MAAAYRDSLQRWHNSRSTSNSRRGHRSPETHRSQMHCGLTTASSCHASAVGLCPGQTPGRRRARLRERASACSLCGVVSRRRPVLKTARKDVVWDVPGESTSWRRRSEAAPPHPGAAAQPEGHPGRLGARGAPGLSPSSLSRPPGVFGTDAGRGRAPRQREGPPRRLVPRARLTTASSCPVAAVALCDGQARPGAARTGLAATRRGRQLMRGR